MHATNRLGSHQSLRCDRSGRTMLELLTALGDLIVACWWAWDRSVTKEMRSCWSRAALVFATLLALAMTAFVIARCFR